MIMAVLMQGHLVGLGLVVLLQHKHYVLFFITLDCTLMVMIITSRSYVLLSTQPAAEQTSCGCSGGIVFPLLMAD